MATRWSQNRLVVWRTRSCSRLTPFLGEATTTTTATTTMMPHERHLPRHLPISTLSAVESHCAQNCLVSDSRICSPNTCSATLQGIASDHAQSPTRTGAHRFETKQACEPRHREQADTLRALLRSAYVETCKEQPRAAFYDKERLHSSADLCMFARIQALPRQNSVCDAWRAVREASERVARDLCHHDHATTSAAATMILLK